MSISRNGEWAALTVRVNSETVMSFEGAVSFQIQDDELTIEPIGLKFRIEEADSKQAILESKGRSYFADVQFNDDDVKLVLNRPRFGETVEILARFQPQATAV